MATLPSWISSHRGDSTRGTFYLVKLHLATPLFLTDCDQPVFWDSETWTPAPLRVDGTQADGSSASGNGGRLSLTSGGPHWQALLAEVAGGTRDFEVTLWEAWLDPAALPSAVPPANAVRLVAVTRVEGAQWDREWAAFTLGPSSDPSLGRLPFREYAPTCTYRDFKGAQCGYSGAATSCDRTLTTCASLSNSARFGGFAAMPADEVDATWNWNDGVNDLTATVTLRRRPA